MFYENGDLVYRFKAQSTLHLPSGQVINPGDEGGLVSVDSWVSHDSWVGPGCAVWAGGSVVNGSVIVDGVQVHSEATVDQSYLSGPVVIHGKTRVQGVRYQDQPKVIRDAGDLTGLESFLIALQ